MGAQQILTDDLTGEEADETVSFGIDGRKYLIDLTSENAKELRESLKGYVSVARLQTGNKVNPVDRNGRSKVRQWAKSQGIEIGDRGRIAFSIMEAYKASQSNTVQD